MLLALVTLFGFGLIHGVGPDHCLAIGTLSAGGDLRGALSVSLRFGLGHSLVLAVLTVGALALGVAIPPRWESLLEALGGASLVALGVWTLVGTAPMAIPHVHLRGTPDHPHAPSRHPALTSMAGAVFGLSGVRGLLLVLPLVVRRNVSVAMAGVALFGAGVVVAMLAVGWLTQSAARLAGRTAGTLRTAVGAASTLVGVYWVLDHVG